MNLFFRYWLPVLAQMALIFYLSSRSSFPVEVPPWAFFADKLVHAVLFGFLALLFMRAWIAGQWENLSRFAGIVTVLFVTGYGITDEVHQMFVPERNPSLADIAADTSGAVIVWLVIWMIRKKDTKKNAGTP